MSLPCLRWQEGQDGGKGDQDGRALLESRFAPRWYLPLFDSAHDGLAAQAGKPDRLGYGDQFFLLHSRIIAQNLAQLHNMFRLTWMACINLVNMVYLAQSERR